MHEWTPAFERCLESIQRLSPAPEESIVAVDGFAPRAEAAAKRAGARIVRTGGCSGPAVARNHAAHHARGNVLFFTDADVLLERPTIKRLHRFFHAHPRAAAAIGSYDDQPEAANFLSQYKNLLNHYMHQRARTRGHTFWGACGAIRRRDFLRIDGFSESYPHPSIEDIELGYRLTASGRPIHVCRTLQVKHLKHWNAASLFKSDFFRRALPWSELILSTRRFENDLNIDFTARVKVALVGLMLALLLFSPLSPAIGLTAAALCGGALILLDAPLLRFFAGRRGPLFALRTIPWQWFYYAYSGAAFLIASLKHATKTATQPRGRETTDSAFSASEGERCGNATP